MKILKAILIALVLICVSSCSSFNEKIKNNYYKVYPAFEYEQFVNYKFYWAANGTDSTFLIITSKNLDTSNLHNYELIKYGFIYELNIKKIDSTILIQSSVDEIFDDSKKIKIFEKNRFLIQLYTSKEIHGDYIKVK